MEVHLVSDTNLFFECKSLEQLPWSDLGYDSVVILLTKPVLDEIDKHKKTNGRTRDRALEIWSRVRGMLTSGIQDIEIQASNPKVVLRRTLNVVPDQAHTDHLDYSKTDERLVGIASTLTAQASGLDVKLFTDDTGPASTADSLGVPYLLINETWRRPAAESSEEKKIKDLQKDLALYRAQEPTIVIRRCMPADESNVIQVIRKIATPLTDDEVEAFLDALRLKHPARTDFTPPPSNTVTETLGDKVTTEYSAPAEVDVVNYRDVLYPQWIESCRTALRGLHQGRDERGPANIVVQWPMANEGTRPARLVRVEFEASGSLVLLRHRDSDDEDEKEQRPSAKPVAEKTSRLPSPPKPPAFPSHVTRTAPTAPELKGISLANLRGIGNLDPHTRALADAAKGMSQFTAISKLSDTFRDIDRATEAIRMSERHSGLHSSLNATSAADIFRHVPRPYLPPRHDAEAFYYDWPTGQSSKKGALTCDLWRHRSHEEIFEFDVWFTKDGETGGTVECTVHADNLTKPAQDKVVIRRATECFNILDVAEAMVEACE